MILIQISRKSLNLPIVPNCLTIVSSTGNDSPLVTVTDAAWNSTTPCGLSLACIVMVAMAPSGLRVAWPEGEMSELSVSMEVMLSV